MHENYVGPLSEVLGKELYVTRKYLTTFQLTLIQVTNQFCHEKVILISCNVKLIRKLAQSILR